MLEEIFYIHFSPASSLVLEQILFVIIGMTYTALKRMGDASILALSVAFNSVCHSILADCYQGTPLECHRKQNQLLEKIKDFKLNEEREA